MKICIKAEVRDGAGLFYSTVFTVPDIYVARSCAESFCRGVSSVIGPAAFSVRVQEIFENFKPGQVDFRVIQSFDFFA